MQNQVRNTEGFPTVRIPAAGDGLPVEVCLIAQLGHGAGNRLFADANARQRGHATFVDALDEPSARLAGTDLRKGDATALYSFAVGRRGHPFHRHAGHRVFTAITGSGGARLRFSTLSDEALHADPANFVRALHHVDIPPDAIFTVRFGGGTWHQFAPLHEGSPHPVFFALSCHTNELGGIAEPALRERVAAGNVDIPSLTELLPEAATSWLAAHPPRADAIPTVRLSLHAPPGSWRTRLHDMARCGAGLLRRARSRRRQSPGFVAAPPPRHGIVHQLQVPADSLLAGQLADRCDHEDTFVLTLDGGAGTTDATGLLAQVLEGFLANRPKGVTWLMRLRNAMVRPLRLRTSPLGCPVSSLLSGDRSRLFAERYPVLDQRVDRGRRRAQVILGADDRHLLFRSCVGVEIDDDGRVRISLGTRVRCRNLFGRLYMALIDDIHRRYISPSMLALATAHALPESAAPEFGDAVSVQVMRPGAITRTSPRPA